MEQEDSTDEQSTLRCSRTAYMRSNSAQERPEHFFHVPPDPRFRLIQSFGLYDERLGERFHLVKEFERPWTQCGYAATKVEKQDFTAEARVVRKNPFSRKSTVASI